MCGLTAAFGKIDHQIHTVFETMLSVSIVRGMDSVGVAGIGNKIAVVKDVVFPVELLRSKPYNEHILKNNNYCLLGHNRAATRGTISQKNAHPFRYKHITLVHNGTLLTHIDNGPIKSETDSESIAIGIANKGIEEVWKELNGDASLVWFDETTKAIHLLSNGKRPLVWSYTKDMKTALIASDRWIIDKPCENQWVPLYKDKVWKPDDHEMWTLSINPKTGLIQESTVTLEAKKSTVYSSQYSPGYHYDENTKGYSRNQSVIPFPKRNTTDSTDVGIKDVSFIAKGLRTKPLMSKEEFVEMFDNCNGCGEALEYQAATVVSDDICYCDGCVMIAEANFLNIASLKGA